MFDRKRREFIAFVARPVSSSSTRPRRKPAYKRGFAMQASLAVIGCGLGLGAWWTAGNWRWALGAIVLVSNWPYTVFGMLSTNNRIMAMQPAAVGPEGRELIVRWGGLHAVRSTLGAISTLIFLWAANT